MGIRLRFVFVVVILAVAAIAAGLMTFNRWRANERANTPVLAAPAAPAPHTAKKPTKPGPVALLKPAGAGATKPKPAPKPAPTPAVAEPPAAPQASASQQAADTETELSGLPATVAKELGAGRVVVVSLYAPKAKVDDTAMREASAGATLAGAAFVKVDVTKSTIDGLNRRYGVLQDPAVLVLRPPGDLIVRIDGFADRDTVAQAAANAAQ